MRLVLAGLCVLCFGGSALAQYGVSNQRDQYGNLVRGNAGNAPGGINQTAPNNNGVIRNAPIQPMINSTKALRTPK